MHFISDLAAIDTMASSQENMDIDLVEESTVQLEADMAVTRCLFEGGVRRVVSDIDKDLARLGMKNRCPKPIHRYVFIPCSRY